MRPAVGYPRDGFDEAPIPKTSKPASQAEWSSLCDAGRALVAEGGLRNLSVRPIVANSGWTMGEFGYRIGKRERLIELVVAAERAAHDEFDAAWRKRLAGVPSFDPASAARVIAAYLDERANRHPDAAIFWEELLLEAAVDETLQPLVAPWIEARQHFWHDLFRGRLPNAEIFARLITYIVAEEQLYSLVLGHHPAYRIVRDILLQRLCSGVLAGTTPSESQLFGSMLDDLAPEFAPGNLLQGRALPVAQAIAKLMVAQGIGAITHRSVAAAAGLSTSAVAHHFPTHLDLVRSGTAAMYSSFYASVDVDLIRQSVTTDPVTRASLVDRNLTAAGLVRATHMISIAGARDSEFAPLVARRRRDRGLSSVLSMVDLFPPAERFDRCAAQLVSMILGGELFLSLAAGEIYRGTSPQAVTDLISISR